MTPGTPSRSTRLVTRTSTSQSLISLRVSGPLLISTTWLSAPSLPSTEARSASSLPPTLTLISTFALPTSRARTLILKSTSPLVSVVYLCLFPFPSNTISTATLGGWAFNDPPTQNIFSNMASSSGNRQKFIKSLLSFFQVSLDLSVPFLRTHTYLVYPSSNMVSSELLNFGGLSTYIKAELTVQPFAN